MCKKLPGCPRGVFTIFSSTILNFVQAGVYSSALVHTDYIYLSANCSTHLKGSCNSAIRLAFCVSSCHVSSNAAAILLCAKQVAFLKFATIYVLQMTTEAQRLLHDHLVSSVLVLSFGCGRIRLGLFDIIRVMPHLSFVYIFASQTCIVYC